MPDWLKALLRVIMVNAVVAVLAAGLLLTCVSRSSVPEFVDPNPTSDFKIVAMGDSYISGEGAPKYFEGTDSPGANTCRRAPTAYPYLIAQEFEASLVFAACSGAVTANILAQPPSPQQPQQHPDIPGGEPQIEWLEGQTDTDVVLLSIGGNDAGFGDIGAGCTAGGDCRESAQYWLHNLDKVVYPALLATFQSVRDATDAEIFALTYPDPLGDRTCAYLPLSDPERLFLKEEFIPRLNQLIDFAAVVAEIRVIPLEHALDGYRICDPGISPGEAGANVLGLGRTSGQSIDILQLPHGSFHPNEVGHELIGKVVSKALRQLRNGELQPIPEPPPPTIPPPPYVPSSIGVPVGPYAFPGGTECDGEEIVRVVPVAFEANEARIPIHIVDAEPGSIICFRGYKEGWQSTQASETGEATVALDTSRAGVGSTIEVLYLSREADWIKVVGSRADVPTQAAGGIDTRIVGVIALIVLALLGMNILLYRWFRHRMRPE